MIKEFDAESSVDTSSVAIATPIYITIIAGAEIIGVLSPTLSLVCHALLLVILLDHYALSKAPYRRILPVLLLVPMLRILSLTIPLKLVSQLYWHAIIGVPLWIAIALTARLLNFSWANLGLRLQGWRMQFLIAFSGLPLGLIAFLWLPLRLPLIELNWRDIVIGSIILIIFNGLMEEIIFRGLLQKISSELFGRAGLFYSNALFASMYFGSLSWHYVLFFGLVGFLFSWWVQRTGLIWGVILAHSFLSIGLLLIWPIAWPTRAQAVSIGGITPETTAIPALVSLWTPTSTPLPPTSTPITTPISTTPTLTSIPILSSTSTPSSTPSPTATLTNTSLPPTSTPTSTLIPPSTATPTNTLIPVTPTSIPAPLPTSTPINTSVPLTPTSGISTGTFKLLHPLSLEEPSYGPTDFEWQWTGPVPAGSGFEVRVWPEGEQPAGVHNAVLDSQSGSIQSMAENSYRLSVNIKDAAGVRGRSGEYLWTVALVQISPNYADLGQQATPARLRFEAGGGGGGGGDDGGGGGVGIE